MMKKTTLLIALLFLISAGHLWAQEMLREIPLQQQIENSSLVVEGKVIAKKSVWNAERNNIYTINTVEVYKVFKGEQPKTIEVITRGGKVGDTEQVVIPGLKLNVNDTGVFTLHERAVTENILGKSSIKKYRVYSSLQGFYKYDLANNVALNPFRSKKDVSKGFYNEIMKYTKTKYMEISGFNIQDLISKPNTQAKVFSPPMGIAFSPSSITAGTQSVLTITGSGFGTTKGKVGFRDADTGGTVSQSDSTPKYIDALDSQVTWSDTQITVEVPAGAGTGDIRVTHDDNSTGVSSAELTITYALINSDDGLGTQHFSANNTGNMTWQLNTDFDANTAAKTAFLRAFETWRCETKINWIIGANTPVSSSEIDGISLVTFDTAANPLPDGLLGRCTYVINTCSPRTVRDLISEADIVFDNDTPWYFGSDPNGVGFDWDFESTALHELGHAHQLGHVIDPNAVMHYNFPRGLTLRDLSTNDINAATVIQGFNTGAALCNTTAMSNYTGSCNLSVEEDELYNAISLYPNPAKNQFHINKASYVNLQKAVIYDISGRLISEHDLANASNTKTIKMHAASKGVYFVNIHSDLAVITKKIVLE
ncbi:T9SS type A sorting domain-containing protein [Gelatiniphilus marinus]|uniref:T9SS type A sorting domain-containing protein n=1 Tax=Gelatiniphilus marinus TaxID=1759464 RepID=A0ABW5JUB5_9FLAO